jgi:hypothetical protein
MFIDVRSRITCGFVFACAGLAGLGASVASGETGGAEGNPYAVISDRNVFHLNPPPPPPPLDPPKPADLRTVMLSGFVGKGDSTHVLMAVLFKDNKQPTLYLNLTPGQRDHDVELLRIRLKQEEVDIVNDGTPMTLTAKSNSFASLSAPQPGGGGQAMPGLRPGGSGAIMEGKRGIPRPAPFAAPPAAAAQPSMAAAAPTEGGAIVIGGGNSSGGAIVSGGSSYGGGATPFGGGAASYGSGNNAIVSGGASFGGGNTPGVGANNTAAQISSLLNSSPGQYRAPVSAAPPLPPTVQTAAMMVQEAAGGPPMPPMPGTEGGPPAPPMPGMGR